MPPATILDIDGTLVDTNFHHAIAWFRAFKQHDIVLPLWRIHRHMGMGGDQLIADLTDEATEEEKGDDIRSAEKALYFAFIEEVEPMEGSRELIADLKERGHRRACELCEGHRGGPLPRPARRARARRRLDHVRRRRAHEASARPRPGGARQGRHRQ